MKIRLGFVSNSSSSSYTCDISGTTSVNSHGCWDGPPMASCCNGHNFLYEYIKCEIPRNMSSEDKWQMISLAFEVDGDFDTEILSEDGHNLVNKMWGYNKKRADAKIDEAFTHLNTKSFLSHINAQKDKYDSYIGELPGFMCPVCAFDDVPDDELLKYLLGRRARKTVIKELRNKFGTYSAFKKAMDNKK